MASNVTEATARGPLTADAIDYLKGGSFIRFYMFICYRRKMSPKEAFDEINGLLEDMDGGPDSTRADEGRTDRFVVCEKTIARWYGRYDDMDNNDICFDDQPRSGRPRRFGVVEAAALADSVDNDPTQSTRSLSKVQGASQRELRRQNYRYCFPQSVPYPLTA